MEPRSLQVPRSVRILFLCIGGGLLYRRARHCSFFRAAGLNGTARASRAEVTQVYFLIRVVCRLVAVVQAREGECSAALLRFRRILGCVVRIRVALRVVHLVGIPFDVALNATRVGGVSAISPAFRSAQRVVLYECTG